MDFLAVLTGLLWFCENAAAPNLQTLRCDHVKCTVAFDGFKKRAGDLDINRVCKVSPLCLKDFQHQTSTFKVKQYLNNKV